MSADIEWVDPAFEKLEALPSTMAFEIIRRVDLLAAFPSWAFLYTAAIRNLATAGN